MKLEDFKSGQLKQPYQYKSFTPTLVNHSWSWTDPKINTLLEQATRALGELNAFSLMVPDIDLFIQMHVAKEATASSRIEGTKTQMDEALMEKEFIAPEKRDDWEEVQNYIRAMNNAIEELQTLPLSNRLLKQTHEVLMQGIRGEHKRPGEYRTSQNWIGGTSLQDAFFIPPYQDELLGLMGDLEDFWHNKSIEVPDLIRIAISHYQFETIHPFLDGNGRIGRLLIPLYLVSKKYLSKPSLYLSAYFEKNKDAYYDGLTTVRASNDLQHWIKFFLVAVLETAKKGKDTFQAILALRSDVESRIWGLGKKAENAKKTLVRLYRDPFIKPSELADYLQIKHPAANALIKDLEALEILREVTGHRRNRIFLFERYFNLFLDD